MGEHTQPAPLSFTSPLQSWSPGVRQFSACGVTSPMHGPYVLCAVHVLVQASRLSDGSRRVVSLTEVTGMEGDVVTLQDLFVFEKRGLDPDGKVVGRFAATGIRPKFYEKLLSAGIRLRPDLFDEVVEV